MIKIEAIIREEKLDDVKDALQKLKVQGMTVSQVMGCGTQLGYSENIRGSRVSVNMLPKIKLEVFVDSAEMEDRTIVAITEAARTGNVGDGKIITYEIRDAVRIRTGERGIAALVPGKNE
jgi:nitrogen regulatory protein P-II 1